MNTFGKFLTALTVVAAALLAIVLLIGSVSKSVEGNRRSSDIKSKLQIAKLRQKKQLSKIAEELTDSISDFRDDDLPLDAQDFFEDVKDAAEDVFDDVEEFAKDAKDAFEEI
ncbi:MAG: hypothetical protein IJP17_01080 [Clostridia bacterium]|nr:hypothetical protein [Clostridia bacterium]